MPSFIILSHLFLKLSTSNNHVSLWDMFKVPFGVIVKCPCCMVAVSVAQPQHGSQVKSANTYDYFPYSLLALTSYKNISFTPDKLDNC